MALSKSTELILDGNGNPLTVVTYTDGTNNGPCQGILGNDGSHFQPSGDAVGREIYCLTTDGTNVLFTSGHPAYVQGTITANAGTNLNTSTLALESGGNLATIATNTGKIPSQGQALAAASLPVVLTAAQVTTLTPPTTVAVTQTTGTNLHTVIDSGTITTVTTLTSITNAITTNADGSVSGGTAASKSFAVGGIYNSSAPTLTNTQQSSLQLDSSGNLKVNVTVGGGSGGNAAASATGSAVPSSADYGGINISGTLRGQTGSNPTGTTYSAHTDLTSVGGTTVTLGQTTMSASIPVVLASNQASIPVTGTVTANAGSGSFTVAQATASSLNATVSIASAQTLANVTTVSAVTSITNAVTVTQATASSLNATVVGLGTAGTPSGGVLTVQGVASGTPLTVAGTITNPTSTLTRPANTTAYAQNNLIASNTTAGSIVVPSFTGTRVSAGNSLVRRLRLKTSATSGWAQTFSINLWSTAPTYTNGDGGAYAVATGSAGYLGTFTGTLIQFGDGASGVFTPSAGSESGIALGSGSSVYWDLQYTGSGSLTPLSAQTFILTAEVYEN